MLTVPGRRNPKRKPCYMNIQSSQGGRILENRQQSRPWAAFPHFPNQVSTAQFHLLCTRLCAFQNSQQPYWSTCACTSVSRATAQSNGEHLRVIIELLIKQFPKLPYFWSCFLIVGSDWFEAFDYLHKTQNEWEKTYLLFQIVFLYSPISTNNWKLSGSRISGLNRVKVL